MSQSRQKKIVKSAKQTKKKSLKFIDLFAGLGGFHLALTQLGHECVFASEIDETLAELYEHNHGIKPHGDIRTVKLKDIPAHDILCAGFPCQPFSKAGEQLGFECPQWGDLFNYIVASLKHHKPEFVLIENVPNILRHKKGKTWERIRTELASCGYDIKSTLISPHMVGVPQVRERAIIVGRRKTLGTFEWPKPKYNKNTLSLVNILETKPEAAKALPDHLVRYIEAWQKLLDQLPKEEELPSFPLWAMEFGASYPFEEKVPLRYRPHNLRKKKGSFGLQIKGQTLKEISEELPPYALEKDGTFPEWKIQFIAQNRAFYQRHKKIIDSWLPTILDFPPSFQKLEWNWKGGPKDLWQTILQFRASGIRAKRPTVAPSLVALTTSQVPIIAWERRYMTMRECAKLQSMEGLKKLPSGSKAYKALGNAVNVKVISSIASQLVGATSKAFLVKASNSNKKNTKKRSLQRKASKKRA